jgi:ubiquinone biosynthesis UbiH/UbiF/VisC/COQ6 family hydroxylase
MKDFDVVIIGRGVIGNLTALAASKANLRVLLVGPKQNLNTKKILGSRSYALSPSSIGLIEKVVDANAMELEHQNISAMHIMNDNGKFSLTAQDANKNYLARIVNHTALMNHVSIPEKNDNVHFIKNKPQSLHYDDTLDGERAIIKFKEDKNSFQVSAKLVIGADGVTSWVRQTAGILWGRKSYNQKAIVAEIVPEKEHLGIACQWFHQGGILALLPCNEGNLSVVWSVSSVFADKVMAEPQDCFMRHLNEISRGKFGTLTPHIKPTSVDLSTTFAESFYGKRIALLGDSAHTVHPLAGLGLNLGIYDLISLIQYGEWFKRSGGVFFDPGNKKKLIHFHAHRVKKIPKVQFSLDALVLLFGLPGSFASSVRGFGMNYIDRFSIIKKNIIRQAHTVF